MESIFGIGVLGLEAGEFIQEGKQNTCVVGYNVAHKYFEVDIELGNRIDINGRKLQRLQENCKRLGITIVQTYRGNMTTPLDLPGYHFQGDRGFHRILVDAPCSGLGILRKHPEAKWTKNESQITELQQLQLRLLTHSVTLLHPDDGVLVYSTCTTEPEENGQEIPLFYIAIGGILIIVAFYIVKHFIGSKGNEV